ncbi:hypothetical protein B5S43_12940, partial [Gilliamella apicola]
MKKYIFLLNISLCSSILLISGCDDKKPTNRNPTQIAVINSYLFHTEPELLPDNKLFKQQKIEGSSNKLINYNNLGYVANYNLDGLYGEINYDKAKYIYGMKETRNEYGITFD